MVTTYSSISLVFNDAEEYPSFTTKTGGFEQVNMGTVSNKTADFVHNDSTVSYIYIYTVYFFFVPKQSDDDQTQRSFFESVGICWNISKDVSCWSVELFGSTPHGRRRRRRRLAERSVTKSEDLGRRGTASRCREDLPEPLHPRMFRSAMHRTLDTIGGSDGPWVDVCMDEYEI